MLARLVRWWCVLVVSWAMRDMPEHQLRDLMGRCFPHRDAAWRDDLFESARLKNRERVMRRVDA